MHLHRRKFNTFVMSAGLGVIAPVQANGLADLTSGEASKGLKLALEKGSEVAVQMLGAQDGFWGNDKVRIMLPEAVNKASKLLKTLGMGKQIDELNLQMNRAAEAAVPMARKWLTQSIQSMSVQDAKAILQGGENSVTQFFESKTRAPLTKDFTPSVKQSLEKLGVVEQFNAIALKLSGTGLLDKDKARLETHVTAKTLDGLYFMIGEEEKKIRQNPAQAGSALLSKVFSAIR